jgi:hypothetical protein
LERLQKQYTEEEEICKELIPKHIISKLEKDIAALKKDYT